MKKFTLEFIDPQLEIEYQNIRANDIQKPVYRILIIGAVSYETVGTLQLFIANKHDQLYLPLSLAIVLFIQVLITFKYPQTTLFNSIFSVYLSTLTILDMSIAQTVYDYYLYGATLQLWQCCVIIMSGFKHSTHMIFVTTTTRVFFTLYHKTEDYRDIFVSIITAITFLVMNYLYDKIARSQFQLSKKDLRWQQYMSSIIEKPYFIFQYDQIALSFNSIEQQLKDYIPQSTDSQNSILRQFLRNVSINNQTLELYLFNYYLKTHVQQRTLDAIYNRKLISIKLYVLNFQTNQYLLIIDTPLLQESTSLIKQKRDMSTYIRFVKSNIRLIDQQPKIFDKLVKSRLQIMNNLFYSSIIICNKSKGVFSLTRIIYNLCKLYRQGYQMNVVVIPDSKIYLNGYRQQIYAFMNHIFLLFHQLNQQKQQNIIIHIEDNDADTVTLKLLVSDVELFLIGYQRSTILKSLESALLFSRLDCDLSIKFIRNIEQSFASIQK